ncbi:MAG: hypothetical protein ROZ64_12225 [Burkholderiaceae bacterium]|nr:hypothetical protein [Burkholderiaceae bacterium]
MTSALPRFREHEFAFCTRYTEAKKRVLRQGPILPKMAGTLVLRAT